MTLQLFKWQMVPIKWWPTSSYKQQPARGKRQSSRCPGTEREGLVEPQRGGNSSRGGWWRRGDVPGEKTDLERIEITWSGQRQTIITLKCQIRDALLKLEEEGVEGLQTVTSPGDTRSGSFLNWCVTGSCGWFAAPPSLWPQLSVCVSSGHSCRGRHMFTSLKTFDGCTFSWWFKTF